MKDKFHLTEEEEKALVEDIQEHFNSLTPDEQYEFIRAVQRYQWKLAIRKMFRNTFWVAVGILLWHVLFN